ncbi:unnamed protein product, partial [Choristocarpus tenellus]
PTSLGPGGVPHGGAMETQQFELQMRLVDIFIGSVQYVRALRLLNQLLKRKIKSGQRSLVLVRLALCYLKVRKLASCEAALERVILEADEALELYQRTGRLDQSHVTHSHRRTGSGVTSQTVTSQTVTSQTAGEAQEAFVSEAVAMVKNIDFLVLRARCRLAAGDPTSAVHWVGVAVAVAKDSGQAGNQGPLMYLQGRCYQAMLLIAAEIGSTSGPVSCPSEGTTGNVGTIPISDNSGTTMECQNNVLVRKRSGVGGAGVGVTPGGAGGQGPGAG